MRITQEYSKDFIRNLKPKINEKEYINYQKVKLSLVIRPDGARIVCSETPKSKFILPNISLADLYNKNGVRTQIGVGSMFLWMHCNDYIEYIRRNATKRSGLDLSKFRVILDYYSPSPRDIKVDGEYLPDNHYYVLEDGEHVLLVEENVMGEVTFIYEGQIVTLSDKLLDTFDAIIVKHRNTPSALETAIKEELPYYL